MARLNRQFRDALRQEARDLWRERQPTTQLTRVVGVDIPADDHVFAVLDLCLLVGEVLLSSGEAAAEAEKTMTRLAAACGLGTVEIDITFTSISMCCRRGRTVAPVTSMRLVRSRTTDLTRLVSVTRIVDRVIAGQMSLEDAEAAVAAAVAADHPYPRWVATAGWAGLAAAVALLLGAGPLIWGTAFVVSAVIDRTGRALGRRGVPPFFLQIMGGLIATIFTLGMLANNALPAATEPSLVIAASITVLLSGLSLMGAVQDAISGNFVTAAGRAAEISLLSAGLLIGVILGLKVGVAFGITLDPIQSVTTDLNSFGVSTLAAVAAAALFALSCYAPWRSLAAAGLAGGLGWAANAALGLVGFGPVVATGLAAILIGVTSELVSRFSSVDRHVIVLAGIIPLLPGLTVYRGFYQLASTSDVQDGLVTSIVALAIALALAAGVTLGQFISRPRPTPTG